MITKEIILHFFEGKCDARDAALVQAWLEENPGKLKEYIGTEEWEEFQPAQVLSPELSGKLWDNIHKITPSAAAAVAGFSRTPGAPVSWIKWTAVAASVFLIAGLSWLLIAGRQQQTATAAAIPVNTFNNTPRDMSLSLSDGSTVELSPNSQLSYAGNFNAKREVLLNGEATFTIAKSAARPFSVSSNNVLVTVLGTRFTVRSDEANNTAKVILHEGSVMIRIAGGSSKDYGKEYYLGPGDIFVYKKMRQPGHTPGGGPTAAPAVLSNDSLPAARVLHLEKDKSHCYVFDNYPLDVVFDQLQIIYHTTIVYNKTGLGNRTFIGKIDEKDSLAHILKSIALLNNFTLRKQDDNFLIGN